MPDETEAANALDLIEADEFKTGPGWKKAHDIAQNHEGEPVFDAIHALLHRIEGDTMNAGYWDRCAGTDFGGHGHAAELKEIAAMIETLKT